jgi:hypothetical protein
VRWSVLLLLVAMTRLALADPKVAVAPLEGDDGGKFAETVGELVGERAKLTKPGRVDGAMKSMGVSVLSAKSLKKLRAKLDVDVVIYGSVARDGKTKRVTLTFAGRNKDRPKLELEASTPKQLRKELEGKLAKRIATAMEGSEDEEEEEEEEKQAAERKAQEERKRKEEEEEERRKEEEEAKREEEARKKKRDRDEDEDDNTRRKKKRVADEDEDEDEDDERVRKRADDEEDEEEDDDDGEPRRKRKPRRHVLTQTALWADAGASLARRTLTYQSNAMNRPPPVGTAAPAGQIAGEVYPAAFGSLKSTAAGLGVYGAYSRTFALGIDVPGTMVTTPIKNGYYTAGARYRFAFAQHSLAAGVGFWRRWYKADRSKLMSADQLDMPDVDYKAIAPGAAMRIGVTPKITAFATVDVPLVLNSGPIQLPANYGSARIIAFEVHGGTQIMLADKVALQVAAEFSQVGFSFTGQAGSKASTREVKKATDRSIGLAATVGFTY